jgi:ribonuclease P protein component
MDAPDLSFPPAMRFHDARDFSRVFNRQQKSAGRHVVVLVRRQEARGGVVPPARLGVMVPAKAVPSAVRRHQLKRWVRELFRTRLAAGMPGMEMLVLLRADPPADAHAAFDAEITEQLRRANAAAAQPGQQRRRGGRPDGGGKAGGNRDGRQGGGNQGAAPTGDQGRQPAQGRNQDQRGKREQRAEPGRGDGPRGAAPPPGPVP